MGEDQRNKPLLWVTGTSSSFYPPMSKATALLPSDLLKPNLLATSTFLQQFARDLPPGFPNQPTDVSKEATVVVALLPWYLLI